MLTATVFDADPNSSSGCALPDYEDREVDDVEEATDLLDLARIACEGCGEYEPGDRLWMLVWDEHGAVVHRATIDMELDPVEPVTAAIARSTSHQEIVTLPYSAAAKAQLANACEDWVDAGQVVEFWGATDDGDQWRVHLERADDE